MAYTQDDGSLSEGDWKVIKLTELEEAVLALSDAQKLANYWYYLGPSSAMQMGLEDAAEEIEKAQLRIEGILNKRNEEEA